jgi:hypothetical protein
VALKVKTSEVSDAHICKLSELISIVANERPGDVTTHALASAIECGPTMFVRAAQRKQVSCLTIKWRRYSAKM